MNGLKALRVRIERKFGDKAERNIITTINLRAETKIIRNTTKSIY